MRGKWRLSTRQTRGLLGGGLSLLLLVTGISYHYAQAHGSLLPLAQKVVPISADAQAGSAKVIDTQAAAPAVKNSDPAGDDSGNAAGQAQSSIEPKMDQILDSSEGTATNNCNDKMDAAVNDYNKDVQKKKDDLLSRIKVALVPSIDNNYVQSYNDDVTELFNNYLSAASKENCTWPIKAPATLKMSDLGL